MPACCSSSSRLGCCRRRGRRICRLLPRLCLCLGCLLGLIGKALFKVDADSSKQLEVVGGFLRRARAAGSCPRGRVAVARAAHAPPPAAVVQGGRIAAACAAAAAAAPLEGGPAEKQRQGTIILLQGQVGSQCIAAMLACLAQCTAHADTETLLATHAHMHHLTRCFNHPPAPDSVEQGRPRAAAAAAGAAGGSVGQLASQLLGLLRLLLLRLLLLLPPRLLANQGEFGERNARGLHTNSTGSTLASQLQDVPCTSAAGCGTECACACSTCWRQGALHLKASNKKHG